MMNFQLFCYFAGQRPVSQQVEVMKINMGRNDGFFQPRFYYAADRAAGGVLKNNLRIGK